jgi:glycosyltransferase involved in cell wall biosynthesis
MSVDGEMPTEKVPGNAVEGSTGYGNEAGALQIELSVVIPCLNEGRTIGKRVRQALDVLNGAGVAGEVIVADNGSTDGSAEIAEAEGARVVRVAEKGYGSALMGGIAEARGEYVLMADADESHDLTHIPRFLAELRDGQEFVMGNRFRGGIADGAMPFLHRYLGNPVLSGLGKLFFKSKCGDFHCGMRGFRRESYQRMDVRSTGMEFASEMVVKATLLRMKISEIATTQLPDGRDHPPHLRTWQDGWRHLRFLLMYSPRWLFLYPGSALILLGAAGCAWLLPQPRVIYGLQFDARTLVYAFAAVLLGFQFVAFALFTKVFAISEGLLPNDARLTRAFRYITLEIGLVAGAVLVALGIGGTVFAFSGWVKQGLGTASLDLVLRLALSSVFSLTLGVQVICSSFFLSILGLRRRSVPGPIPPSGREQ